MQISSANVWTTILTDGWKTFISVKHTITDCVSFGMQCVCRSEQLSLCNSKSCRKNVWKIDGLFAAFLVSRRGQWSASRPRRLTPAHPVPKEYLPMWARQFECFEEETGSYRCPETMFLGHYHYTDWAIQWAGAPNTNIIPVDLKRVSSVRAHSA